MIDSHYVDYGYSDGYIRNLWNERGVELGASGTCAKLIRRYLWNYCDHLCDHLYLPAKETYFLENVKDVDYSAGNNHTNLK